MPHTEWRPTRRPGRPPRLSREQIVAAALEIDLDALTMPAVAARLDVSTQALYYWVDNRDELINLIGDVLVARITPSEQPLEGDWRAWLAELAWGMFHELLAVPGFTGRIFARRHGSPAREQLQTCVVETLVAAGLGQQAATDTWDVFGTSVLGWLAAHAPGAGAGAPRDVREAERRFWLLLNTLLRGLPANAPRM